MPTLYHKMRQAAIEYKNRDAIVFYGRRIKFGQLLRLIDSVAGGLKESIKKGEVVTICMPNTPSAQIAFYAINRLGAIVNLVHPHIPAHQLLQSIQKTKSKMLIAYDLYLSRNAPFDYTVPIYKCSTSYFMGGLIKPFFGIINHKKLKDKSLIKSKSFEKLFNHSPIDCTFEEFEEKQPAVFLPSGGTSAEPKIVMHTCDAFNRLCSHAQFFLTDPIPSYKAIFSVLPIFHGFGLCMSMHMCAVYGVTNVMNIKFDPKRMAKAIQKEGVGIAMGVPMMFSRLLKNKHFLSADLSTLKDVFVGGDAVPIRLIEEFNQTIKKQNSTGAMYVGYGLTETVAVCTVNTVNKNKQGSIGVPLPDTNIMIMGKDGKAEIGEVGEICINSPIMMLGYLDTEENPIKNIDGKDWLFTGDLGYMTSDGFLHFKQRKKSMIKVSGVPVFPCEVEEVAQKIDGVVRAAAVAMQDPLTGEAVKLFIEYKGSDYQGLKAEIMQRCKQELINYAVPKSVVFKKSLPLNSIGKVDIKELEKM